jgi:hypothetical protein
VWLLSADLGFAKAIVELKVYLGKGRDDSHTAGFAEWIRNPSAHAEGYRDRQESASRLEM